MQWDVKIRLRDGIQLSAILYLPPEDRSPSPAIVMMTPYVAQTHHEQAVDYANHGYPFLIVDVRGRGNSEGTFDPRNEGTDGYDVVEWLARQPCCNGRVGMCGGSYQGYCQWVVASQRPPHLATIVPVAAAYYGVDFPLRNNIFFAYSIQWLTFVSGHAAQTNIFADRQFWRRKFKQRFQAGIPFEQLDTLVGNPSALFREWIAHPQRDAYWDSYNPSPEQCASLSLPILTITGAYDSDQLGALEHYRQHVSNASPENLCKHYLIIGPWDHAGCAKPQAHFAGLKVGPASLLDLRKLHREWYAWTLEGSARPEFLQKQVAHYVIGTEEWRYAESLESITARSQPFYLESTATPTDIFTSGSLESKPGIGGPDWYVDDPREIGFSDVEFAIESANLTDQRLVNAAIGRQLVYHSRPFAQDTEISGFFKLSVWLAIDQPDADFQASVYEVAVDGTVTYLTSDWLRARYREGLYEAKRVQTTMPLRYEFERFTFVSRRIRAGNRLRLVFGPLVSIQLQRNYHSGGTVSAESLQDARAVTVRLFHDPSQPSALHVPFGQRSDARDR